MSRMQQLLEDDFLLPHEKEWLEIYIKYPFLIDEEVIGYWLTCKEGYKNEAEEFVEWKKKQLNIQ